MTDPNANEDEKQGQGKGAGSDSNAPVAKNKSPATGKSTRPKRTPAVKLNQRRRARKLILQALYQWQMAKASVNVIEAEFRDYNEGRMDWDFFHEVFTAIPARVNELDAHCSPFLDRHIDSLDPIELAILRMGIFEFTDRIDVPYKVVISELVELAKIFGATDSYKYINGVLDKAARVLRPLEI